ncbi:MAG: hypothetical protein MR711_08705 [Selenomonas sp.]|uniref:DUF5672 family protein n=1 Tax=Selenomonas sp. TaxID=2053611 RepID=UPI0025D021DD|nr:DUF5672 family protein [Selenomonas sp.]MCI6086309.1 hypothetical protein [Selenomonas sp.]MDY4417006.1 DUF5672 family protein [Selenomonas sp.]
MKQVVVVIPIYKEQLTQFEQVSLTQAKRVLGRYDICFMAPERMRAFLEERGARAEYWPDACFDNRLGYSKLLLTPEFYEHFADYEYLLIYQLDAFVFSDQLEAFCAMGYDYIGAPMPYWFGWPYGWNHVGNGGLSLRKIPSCIHVTRNRASIYKKTQAKSILEVSEDRFFTYCGWDKQIDFATPSTQIATDFAVEFEFSECYRRISKGWLPFGCHGWSKTLHFARWERHIRAAGYAFEDDVIRAVRRKGRGARKRIYEDGIISTLIENMKRSGNRAVAKDFSWMDGAILWGNGIVGERAQSLFEFLGFHAAYIFDRGDPAAQPVPAVLHAKRHKILVTSERYYDEIAAELASLGLRENVDFFRYHAIERKIAAKIAEEKYHGKRFAWL